MKAILTISMSFFDVASITCASSTFLEYLNILLACAEPLIYRLDHFIITLDFFPLNATLI